MTERGVALSFQTRGVIISNFWTETECDASRASVLVATTIYETENCGGDDITPGEDVSRTNSDLGGGGGGGGGRLWSLDLFSVHLNLLIFLFHST